MWDGAHKKQRRGRASDPPRGSWSSSLMTFPGCSSSPNLLQQRENIMGCIFIFMVVFVIVFRWVCSVPALKDHIPLAEGCSSQTLGSEYSHFSPAPGVCPLRAEAQGWKFSLGTHRSSPSAPSGASGKWDFNRAGVAVAGWEHPWFRLNRGFRSCLEQMTLVK